AETHPAEPAAPVAALGTIRLTADRTVSAGSSETVTFSIPFAPRIIDSPDQLAVRDGGVELPAHVEAGLHWHGERTGIRSIVVQLQNVDMRHGERQLTFDTHRLAEGQQPAPRLAKSPIEAGYARAGRDKANLPFPRVFALLTPAYLAGTELIPPY